MIHPSYNELIEIINQGNEDGENPQINSRYSIVMAAARRARQIIDGEEPLVSKAPTNKPLSVAVEEIRRGKIKITEEGVDDFQFHLRNNDGNTGVVYDEEGEQSESESESEDEEDEEGDGEENEAEEDDRDTDVDMSEDDDAE